MKGEGLAVGMEELISNEWQVTQLRRWRSVTRKNSSEFPATKEIAWDLYGAACKKQNGSERLAHSVNWT